MLQYNVCVLYNITFPSLLHSFSVCLLHLNFQFWHFYYIWVAVVYSVKPVYTTKIVHSPHESVSNANVFIAQAHIYTVDQNRMLQQDTEPVIDGQPREHSQYKLKVYTTFILTQ